MTIAFSGNKVSLIDRCKSFAYTGVQDDRRLECMGTAHIFDSTVTVSENLVSSVSTLSHWRITFPPIFVQLYLVSLHELRVYISHAVPTLLLLPD